VSELVIGSSIPTITPSYSGFVPDEGAGQLSVQPTCGTNYTTGSVVGTYRTTCSSASATNYSFKYVDGSIRVIYGWDGFLQPINDTAHTGLTQSKFKLGQTIPAKFVIKNAAGQVVQQAGSPTFTRSGQLGSCGPDVSLEAVTSLSADSGSAYKWDGSQYHYNWNTKGLTAGVYRIYANLSDGTARSVDICLTK
jgi:hypothetical protein